MAVVKRSQVRLDDYRFPHFNNFSGRASEELENGFVAVLGDVEEGNRDIRELTKPTAEANLVLVANDVHIYDTSTRGSATPDKYFMEAEEAVRVYGLHKTMKFGVTKEGIDGTPVVGEYLVAGAGWKLVPSATVPAAGFAAKIIREDAVGGALSINTTQTPTTYVVVEVVQNDTP